MEILFVAKTSGAKDQTATMFVALELGKNRGLVAVHSPIMGWPAPRSASSYARRFIEGEGERPWK